MNYRDIRKDLMDRLEGIKIEERTAQQVLDEIRLRKSIISRLLDDENRRFQQARAAHPSLPLNETHWTGTIGELITAILQDGEALHLDTIKAKALERGLKEGVGSLGRVLHGALVSMKRQGMVEALGDGVWRLAEEGSSGSSEELSDILG